MSICIKLVSVVRSAQLSDKSCPHEHVAHALVITQTYSFFPRVQLHKTVLDMEKKVKDHTVLIAESRLKYQPF